MKKLLWAALALLAPALLPALAFGQSSPSLYNGQVPTASQWNGYFSSKQDYLGTSGTGVLLRQNGAVLVAPTLGVATGTSLKLGTITLGSNLLGVGGSGVFGGAVLPATDSTYALGSNSAFFTDGYVNNLRLGTPSNFATLQLGSIGLASAGNFAAKWNFAQRNSAAPIARADTAMLAMGNGAWDGTTTGFFSGSASGTYYGLNAASGFGGNLADLQVNGVSKFSVGSGGAAAAVTLALGGATISTNDIAGPQWSIRTSDGRALFNGRVNAAAGVAFLDSGQAQLASDLILTRAAAGSVTVSNGGSNSFTVTAGAAGAATFGGAVTSSGFTANGNVLGYSLQSSNANTGNAGGSSLAAAGADKLYVQAHSNNDTATAGTAALYSNVGIDVPTLTATNARTYTNAATVEIEGAPVASTNVTVTNPWALYVRTGAAFFGGTISAAGNIDLTNTTMTRINSLRFGTNSATILQQDADNSLALRNGTNLQTFNLYGTYTDASNYERAAITYDSGGGRFRLFMQRSGSGSARPLDIGGDANSIYLTTNATGRWQIDNSGHFLAVTDNLFDIGASGANRPRNGYFASGVFPAFLQMSATSTSGIGVTAGAAGFAKIGVPAYTDNSGQTAGTYAQYNTSQLGIPTLTATNAVTYTNAATLTIEGAPVASTNVTATNPWALYVRTGASFFGANVKVQGDVIAVGYLQLSNTTVSGLRTCNSGNRGLEAYVTDGTQTFSSANFGATPTGSGSNSLKVTCDGGAWRIGELDLPAANDNVDLYPGVENHAAA